MLKISRLKSVGKLAINKVNDSDAGRYRVVASNSAGKVTSPEIRLLMLKRAIITKSPKGDELRTGETLSMTVAASGTEPLKYIWKRNGVILNEFAGPNLELLNIQSDDAGVYQWKFLIWVELST